MQETPPRVSVMQMTAGYVLVWDTGRTEAFATIPQVTSAVKRGLINYKPPKHQHPQVPTAASPTTETASSGQPDPALAVEAFNFGRVVADTDKLSLQDFERAQAAYFPHLVGEPWDTAIGQYKQAIVNRPAAPAVEAPKETARERAQRHLTSDTQVNKPGSAWRCGECGRVSDCIINTAQGIQSAYSDGHVCSRCQQCIDNECPLKPREEQISDDIEAEEPRDIEPDDDSPWEAPGIILNEHGERIGQINPGEESSYATV